MTANLALIGQAAVLGELTAALERAASGTSVLALVWGASGPDQEALVAAVAARAADLGLVVHHARADEHSTVVPGGLARELAITPATSDDSTAAYFLERSQWVDATSLGSIHYRLATAPAGTFVLLSGDEPSRLLAMAFSHLAEVARRRGKLIEVDLAPIELPEIIELTGGDDELATQLAERAAGSPARLADTVDQAVAAGALEWVESQLVSRAPLPAPRDFETRLTELERPARKLVEATIVSGGPLSVPVAAALLDRTPDDVIELAEHLAHRGFIADGPHGYEPADPHARLQGARRRRLLGELADAETALGLADREPGRVGLHFLGAGRWDEALTLLSEAGLSHTGELHPSEAYPFVDGALRAFTESHSSDPELEGRLRLARAGAYRFAGWSERAAEDLEVATSVLRGEQQVHAFGYAAQVADDQQHPTEAERHSALGQLAAIEAEQPGMQGSLLTLQARSLSRLGLAAEADSANDKGQSLLRTHGTAMQRHWGTYNAAWIASDQGRARDAETMLSSLVDEATRIGDPSLLADREAWRSRALFQIGRVDDALAAHERAIEHADVARFAGPVFLSHMALAEGAGLVGLYEISLEAADEMLALVVQQFPAWENGARFLRARALLGLGRIEDAGEEIALAAAACPPGADGRRWWLRIRSLQMEIAAARGEPWPQSEAEELTDEMLQGRWYGSAVSLMTVRAVQEKDPELAAQAAGLATQIGRPIAAAEAIHAGRLWKEPIAPAVAGSIRDLTQHLPADWRTTWESRPAIAAALEAPAVDDDTYREAAATLAAQVEDALSEAGLADVTTMLSPAQRRAAGRVRRRRRRRWPALAAAALLGGVLVIGGVAVASLLQEDPAPATVVAPAAPPATAPEVTTTTTTLLPIPEGGLTGRWSDRGETVDGIPSVSGHRVARTTAVVGPEVEQFDLQWRTSGRITSAPAVQGKIVAVGSTDERLYVWNKPNSPPRRFSADGEVGPPVVFGESVYFGTRDGTLGELFAVSTLGELSRQWRFPAAGPIDTAPLIHGEFAYVTTTNGKLHAVHLARHKWEDENWTWPDDFEYDDPPTGRFAVGGVLKDGRLFAALNQQDGEASTLYAIEIDGSGDQVCADRLAGEVKAMPIVVGNEIIVGTSPNGFTRAIDAETCNARPGPGTGVEITSAPVIHNDLMYVAAGPRLQVSSMTGELETLESENTDREFGVDPCVVPTDSQITSPLALALASDGRPIVYFGTDDGTAYAIDGTPPCQVMWKYETGETISATPAIMNGAVLFASEDGSVYVLGTAPNDDAAPLPATTLSPTTTSPTTTTPQTTSTTTTTAPSTTNTPPPTDDDSSDDGGGGRRTAL
ncbi:MAG: PQQ-binding-like beta-propeller repeat protein [Acidimicrobiia bacterium]|nr:PQQ-binding-like beta-propeller repeat protein [Acidimicrobiia bacterium]